MADALTTAPQDQAETGLLGDYNPVVYGVSPSNIYRPGKQEWVVASTYLKRFLSGQSMKGIYDECVEALLRLGLRRRSSYVCKRWLEREHVKAWVEEELKLHAIGKYWTKERWLLKMTEHLEGRKRLLSGDLYGMKLVAGVMGWEVPETVGIQSIMITQSDGRA